MDSHQSTEAKDFLYDDTFFSLSKYIGRKIVDIVGYPSDPFGGTPVFVITQIIFEGGLEVFVEGEHDTVYLPADDKVQNMSEDILSQFIEHESAEE